MAKHSLKSLIKGNCKIIYVHVKRNVDGDFRIENAKHIVYGKSKGERPLKGLSRGYQRIYCSYKGKNYKAKVLPSGMIKMVPSGQLFDSPSTAAQAIIDRGAVNGWSFWKYKDSSGNLVAIKHLRK